MISLNPELIYTFIFGACIGSFLNIVILRIPRNEPIIEPRSHCTNCSQKLTFYETLPIISWLLQSGRCRNCNVFFGYRYLVIELLTAIVFAASIYAKPTSFENSPRLFITISTWILFSLLITLSCIDIDHLWLPSPITILGILSGISVSILKQVYAQGSLSLFDSLEHLFASILSFLIFELLRITGSCLFRKTALGKGDSKLAAMLGAWLGVFGALIAFKIAFITAGVYVVFGLFLKKLTKSQPIPLGPFLSLAGLAVWFCGNEFWVTLAFRFNESLAW